MCGGGGGKKPFSLGGKIFFFLTARPPRTPREPPAVCYSVYSQTGASPIHTQLDQIVYSAFTVTDDDGTARLLIDLQGFGSTQDAYEFLHELMGHYDESDLLVAPAGKMH